MFTPEKSVSGFRSSQKIGARCPVKQFDLGGWILDDATGILPRRYAAIQVFLKMRDLEILGWV